MIKNKKKCYICIDLKTFFASVECSERNLDPFETNLVVADPSRGNGALCLAITPKMKTMGIKNRCRIFEIPKDVEYITALPRMNLYMDYSARIYEIYLRYVSENDIHVYSIDECFIDITPYLKLYNKKPKEFAQMLMDAVFEETHITATAGIGTNLYLAKIALDIISKHVPDNIGMLTERMYQKYLWHHQPLTDFWHVGVGTMNHLARMRIYDMYGITQCSEDILYKEFGINAEYIIDHAYGKEPTTIAQIKAYEPQTNSISNSQVLFEDYEYYDALLVVKEMVDLLVTRLISNHLVTDNIALYVGYSRSDKNCPVTGSGGQRKLTTRTSSLKIIMKEFIELYHLKVLKNSKIRQISISLGNVLDEYYESYDLFSNIEQLEEEKNLQRAFIQIKEKYGKNAILKGMNKLEKSTTEKRNTLVGGHNAT